MNFSNLQFTLRLFFKNGTTSAIAILVLAIGLGLSITMFTLSHMILWDSPQVKQNRELVTLDWVREFKPGQRNYSGIHILDAFYFKEKNKSLEKFVVVHPLSMSVFNPDTNGEVKRYEAARTDGDFFNLVDAQPILGRVYTNEDKGEEDVVVISHFIWQEEFDGAKDVLGKSLLLEGQSAKIIGVMPEGFAFPFQQKIWKFNDWEWDRARGRKAQSSFMSIGLLKKGVDAETAEVEFANLAANLKAENPENNKDLNYISIKPFHTIISNPSFDAILYALLIGAIFVLLIACANVSNLILARVSKRQFELTMRKVLGARKREIASQVLLDALIIGILGAALGFLIGGWSNRIIWTLFTNAYPNMPYWWSMDITAEVFTFGITVMLIAVVISSLSPLIKILKRHNIEALKDNSRTSSNLSASRAGKILVGTQIMLTVVLLVTASFFTLNSLNDLKRELPYDADNILVNSIRVAHKAGFASEASVLSFYDQIQSGIRAIPGVNDVGFSSYLFRQQSNTIRKLQIDSKPIDPKVNKQRAAVNIISPSYFDVMGGEIILGRTLKDTDTKDSLPVVIVNQNFVNEYFPDENPLGKKIQLQTPGNAWEPQNQDKKTTQWLTIVGVTTSLQSDKGLSVAKKSGNTAEYLVAYIPTKQWVSRVMNIVITGQGDVTQYAKQVGAVIAKASSSLAPYSKYQTIQQILDNDSVFMVVVKNFIISFAFVALIMAAAGLYGIASFTSDQKKREYGIHMALGASKTVIIGLVLKTVRLQVILGVSFGILLAYALNSVLAQQLGNQLQLDLITELAVYSVGVFTVLIVLAFTMLLPAIRSANLPPNIALRSN